LYENTIICDTLKISTGKYSLKFSTHAENKTLWLRLF
jgi:hypothetical protein